MKTPTANQLIVVLSSAAVIIAVVTGLRVLGPPSEERARRLDKRRLEDLQGIERATNLYWTRREHLPASLDELAAEAGANISAREPATARLYDYRVIDPKTYELCGNFQRDSVEQPSRLAGDFWSHGVGKQCFQLKVKETSHP